MRIDTAPVTYRSTTIGPAHIIMLDVEALYAKPVDQDAVDRQLAWLQADLDQANRWAGVSAAPPAAPT